VCELLILLRKLKLARTKPLTGSHAARGPRFGHGWSKALWMLQTTEITLSNNI